MADHLAFEDEKSLQHLVPWARKIAILSNEERIQRVRTDRWIGYTKAEEAITKLENLFTHPSRHRMPNLLIIGPTNNGKTMIIEKFRRMHLPPQKENSDFEELPVVVVQMPSMTLQGYVPWIIDTLDSYNSECPKHYATQYRTLLPPKTKWIIPSRKRYKKEITYYLPWIIEPYGKEHLLCVECLRTDLIPYERIFWRLGIMASCPIHRCLLDASNYWVARLIPACIPIELADENLLFVDNLSFQALTIGEVTLANGCSMSAAVYVRFLRSLIAEICCPFSVARRCNRTLLDIWDQIDIDIMFWDNSMRSVPFERLSLPQRRDVLRIIGILLCNLPMSLTMWQAETYDNRENKRQVSGAIAETI